MMRAAWPRFLPDLTTWHAWHDSHGTIPDPWKGGDLPAICRALGVPEWRVVRPWRLELPGIAVDRRQDATEKVVTWNVDGTTLRARWVFGPDGDWWQSEYPVKSRADLDAARKIVAARTYIAEPARIPRADGSRADLMMALELPRSPLPELFHAFLGWSEGLMLFLEEPDFVRELAGMLDEKVRGITGEIARMDGVLAIAPDNLDARFIGPDMFSDSIAPLYARVAGLLHGEGKSLVVHVGGPVRSLLPGLAACGVDCAEGICGAPQGDSTLAEARAACGPEMVLWGGIAQDFLLSTRTAEEFAAAAGSAFAEAAADGCAVVGVADMVPLDAVPERLRELARMARAAAAPET
jgi:hypothetical protein